MTFDVGLKMLAQSSELPNPNVRLFQLKTGTSKALSQNGACAQNKFFCKQKNQTVASPK
jgi:hypothetical protein